MQPRFIMFALLQTRVHVPCCPQAADQTKILEQLSKRCSLLEARLRGAQSRQAAAADATQLREENTRLRAQLEALRAQAAKQATNTSQYVEFAVHGCWQRCWLDMTRTTVCTVAEW